MTQTIRAEKWAVDYCAGCNKRRMKPVGRTCRYCEDGVERPRGRTLQGRSYLPNLASEMEKVDMTPEDFAHEIDVPMFRLVNYASCQWTVSDELAEEFADVLMMGPGGAQRLKGEV